MSAAEPITAAQRRAIFAAGRARGLDADALRGLTPAGSISALTVVQAAALIDRLNAPAAARQDGEPTEQCPRQLPGAARPPRLPRGIHRIATRRQRNYILWLRDCLGWSGEFFETWLSARHFADGRPMTQIDSARDAAEVIELLKAVKARHEGTKARRHEGTI